MDYVNIINQPTKKENSFLSKLQYVMVFLLIYISSSFCFGTMPGIITLTLHFMCIFILFTLSLLCGKKISINSKMAIKAIVLILIIGIGSLSAIGDESKQTIINILYILIAYLYALNFEFDSFIKKFADVLYFLCWYSIIVYFINLLLPDVISLLPDIKNVNGLVAKNAGFSTIYNWENARNQSVFWEPGAFQTYINIALIIEFFYGKTLNKKRLIIYSIALFTTYSTTGYITALFIVYAYVVQLLLSSKNEDKNHMRNIFFILTIVIVVIVVFVSMESSLANQVFGKLANFRDSGYNTSGGKISSASVRFDAFIRPFKVFWQYPMFGAGTRGMTNFAINERYNMNTCTFVNWFAYFGIFFGAMILRMYYKFAKRFSNNKLIVFMIFFAIFLATATENYYRNPSILIFAFFPFINKEDDIKNENLIEYQQL